MAHNRRYSTYRRRRWRHRVWKLAAVLLLAAWGKLAMLTTPTVALVLIVAIVGTPWVLLRSRTQLQVATRLAKVKVGYRQEFTPEVKDRTYDAASDGRGGHWCAHCLKPYPRWATEVDHIVECFDGGTNDPINAQILCIKCHDEKSARSRRRRALRKAA